MKREKPRSKERGFFNAVLKTELVFALAHDKAFALCRFAGQLANPADALGFFARTLFRRLFIMAAQLHLTKDTFALKLFLQDPIGLIDIIITYRNFHVSSPL